MKILFSASIYNINTNEPIAKTTASIQYFDINTNTWTEFVPQVIITNGEINYSFTMPRAKVYTSIKQIIETGTIPSFRLTKPSSTGSTYKAITEVLAFSNEYEANSSIEFQKKTEPYVKVYFGNLWLLEKDLIARLKSDAVKNYKTEALVAQAIPNKTSIVYPAQRVAMMRPELFERFEPSKNYLFIEDTKLNNSDLLEQINDLKRENKLQILKLKEYEERLAVADDTIANERTHEASKVYTSVVNEITKAAEGMNTGKYNISKLSLDLKVMVKNDENGMKLQLIDDKLASKVSAESLSSLIIEIQANELNTTNTNSHKAPTVIGLTETEARKKLMSYGLKMKPIYQLVEKDKYTIGQAFKQSPDNTDELIEGSTVTVIFAKDNNIYN